MKNMLNIGLVAVLFGLTACPTKEKIEPKCTNDRYLKDDGRTVNLGDTFWLSYKEKVILKALKIKVSFSKVISHTTCPPPNQCIVGESINLQITYFDSSGNKLKDINDLKNYKFDSLQINGKYLYTNMTGLYGFETFVKSLDTCQIKLMLSLKQS